MDWRWKSLSLRWKLVLGSTLIETVMLTLLVINNVRLIETSLQEQAELRLRELSVLLNASIAPSMAALDYGPIQGIFAQSRRKEGITYFALFDAGGKQVAGDGWPTAMPLPAVQTRQMMDARAARLDVAIPIGLGDQTYGLLQFGVSTEFLAQARGKLLRQSLMIAALEIVSSIVLLVLMGIWLTRHLSKLEAASIAVGHGDFGVKVAVDSADEIGRVAQAFNAMATEIGDKLSALGKSEASLRAMFDNANEGIWVIDTDRRTIKANRALVEMLATTEAEIRGESIYAFVDAENADVFHAQTFKTQNAGAGQHYEITLTSRDGRKICCLFNSAPLRDADGSIVGSFALVGDITARKAVEAHLQLAASVFTHAREGIVITDAAGTILEVNHTFTQITGYTHDEVLGQNPRILQSGRQSPEFYAAMWQTLLEQGHWSGEIWNRRKDGEIYVEMLTIGAVSDARDKTQNYVALFSDITHLKEHQQQLEHIAHYDALTNLPNRVLLADRLQQAMFQTQRRGLSLAVVYLDLDGFKSVNDKHGHDVGDALLLALAQCMKAALREGDTLSRIGGDEFVAVLVDLEQPQDCEPVLERLLQAASGQVIVDNEALQVSASIGVTHYPRDGVDADQLMRHADQAMYVAKQAGKNRYHLFDVEQDTAIKTRRESLEHIRQALERREFVLYYQPKVNMRSGALIGVEALIRWPQPDGSILPPAAFLPIIENHPLSVTLGHWVIDAALAQIGAWKTAGLDIPVSVNIGALQLQQPDFVSQLATLLAKHPDVQPGSLELEILETSALEDVMQVSEVMHATLALGVHFALDDFGTGYSSLTYLKRLPAKLLKIDQSFVRDMLDDADDRAIVEGILGLAKVFRRQSIAEGVESAAHGKLLLSLGCDLAQGYGIARPMPAEHLTEWMATWRPHAAWAD